MKILYLYRASIFFCRDSVFVAVVVVVVVVVFEYHIGDICVFLLKCIANAMNEMVKFKTTNE